MTFANEAADHVKPLRISDNDETYDNTFVDNIGNAVRAWGSGGSVHSTDARIMASDRRLSLSIDEYPEESPDQRPKRRIFESRGTIAVKGKGDMESWILESSSNASA